jgi:hypothetical protein
VIQVTSCGNLNHRADKPLLARHFGPLTGGFMVERSNPDNVQERPNPNERLVRVFDTEQESEAMVVHGLLESAGIDSDVTSLDAQQDILPGVGGTVILVREEDAGNARSLIEEFRRSPAEVAMEGDLNEEP